MKASQGAADFHKPVLTRTEIEQLASVETTHILNPNARRRGKSLGDLTGLSGIGFHLIEVEPGFSSTELHVHRFEDECVYILEGEATITLGADQVSVGPGDFVAYPAGGPAHTMRNTGSATLKCLVVGQRLTQEVVDYPAVKKRLYRNGAERDLVDYANIGQPTAGKKI